MSIFPVTQWLLADRKQPGELELAISISVSFRLGVCTFAFAHLYFYSMIDLKKKDFLQNLKKIPIINE